MKIVLVAALFRRQTWAYPAMLAFLVAFIAYQCYRLALSPSAGLALLTVFDALVVWLVWRWRWFRMVAGPDEPAATAGDAVAAETSGLS